MISYRLQLLQSLSDLDKTKHRKFYTEMLENCVNENEFMEYLIFNDEPTVICSNELQTKLSIESIDILNSFCLNDF